jgi:hypothetical protein
MQVHVLLIWLLGIHLTKASIGVKTIYMQMLVEWRAMVKTSSPKFLGDK